MENKAVFFLISFLPMCKYANSVDATAAAVFAAI